MSFRVFLCNHRTDINSLKVTPGLCEGENVSRKAQTVLKRVLSSREKDLLLFHQELDEGSDVFPQNTQRVTSNLEIPPGNAQDHYFQHVPVGHRLHKDNCYTGILMYHMAINNTINTGSFFSGF